MSEKHDRVLAALELREPDRVPVLDLMNEYSTNNAILGRRPGMTAFPFTSRYTARLLDRLFPLTGSTYLIGIRDGAFRLSGFRGGVADGV